MGDLWRQVDLYYLVLDRKQTRFQLGGRRALERVREREQRWKQARDLVRRY